MALLSKVLICFKHSKSTARRNAVKTIASSATHQPGRFDRISTLEFMKRHGLEALQQHCPSVTQEEVGSWVVWIPELYSQVLREKDFIRRHYEYKQALRLCSGSHKALEKLTNRVIPLRWRWLPLAPSLRLEYASGGVILPTPADIIPVRYAEQLVDDYSKVRGTVREYGYNYPSDHVGVSSYA
jgi:hypothetical protein